MYHNLICSGSFSLSWESWENGLQYEINKCVDNLLLSILFYPGCQLPVKVKQYLGLSIADWFRYFLLSSSLRPGTKGVSCGKWIIGYNFGIDDGAESKFGTQKELILLLC